MASLRENKGISVRCVITVTLSRREVARYPNKREAV
jgi:hypothetical protein